MPQLFPQLPFLIILSVAFVLLLTETIRTDVVAVLIVLALYIFRQLDAKDALAGFSSEPAIVVAAIFVLSGALHQTGLSETAGAWIGRVAGSSNTRILAVVMPTVAVLSAFTHHVTTTAVMLPVLMNLSREKNIPSSKLLMPLSFAASLGTTITIIGAPAFLIASGLLQGVGRPGLGVFSIAPIGIAISVAGTIYTLTVGRFLLPSRRGAGNAGERFRLNDYFAEVSLLKGSPFIGKTVTEVEADEKRDFRIAGWLRGGRPVDPPYDGKTLSAGDVLMVRASPEDLVAFREETTHELTPVERYGKQPETAVDTLPAGDSLADGARTVQGPAGPIAARRGESPKEEDAEAEDAPPADEPEEVSDRLVQAVVAPGSDLAGRTIGDVDFRRRYGVLVVGMWRKDGWLKQELARTRLHPGDVLVLYGDEEAISRVSTDRAFLMLVPFQGEPRRRQKAYLAGAIMLGTIVLAATNLMTIEMAALLGAVTVVLTRCVTPRQAYRSIDTRIFVFIAGAIPLGTAMEKSGTSKLLAGWLQVAIGSWNPTLILIALFAIVAVLTQFMSDSATTALFGPVAIALAQALGHPPEAYVVTVAMASVAAFLTPIGHHGNLLIYGPGRYQFMDFVRVGTPLTLLTGVIVAVVSQLIWR